MKSNVIDIIQRFQTRHALEEERELKDFHASGNGAVAPSIPDKNSTPENSDKDIDINRSRPNETTRDIPVIVLTASNWDRDIAECQRFGAVAYMVKPVGFQNFREIAARLNLAWTLVNPKADTSRAT